RYRVRNLIADGILAFYDRDDAEMTSAPDRTGKHDPIGHIQLLANGHKLARSFVAERTCQRSGGGDQEEQRRQPPFQGAQEGRRRGSPDRQRNLLNATQSAGSAPALRG